MSLITELGEENNLNVHDLSFCNINCLKEVYSTTENINKILNSSIETGKKGIFKYMLNNSSSSYKNTKDIYSFELTIRTKFHYSKSYTI